MAMLTLRIDDELNDRIAALAKRSGRTKTYFIKRLILEAIEDLEDETASEDDVEGLELTSEGYEVDGFVVDDNPGKKPRSRASSVASVDTKMAKRMTTLFNRIEATNIPPTTDASSEEEVVDV